MTLAFDDGIWSGNATLADWFYLVGLILLVVAAVGATGKAAVLYGWTVAAGYLGLALVAAGLLVT